MDRQLMKDPKDLEEILVFSDGSLSFSGYLIYMVIREDNGYKTMKLIRSGSKTQNSSVPVSEHIARTIGINVLYGILSVLHFHFGDDTRFGGRFLNSFREGKTNIRCNLSHIYLNR